MTESDSARPADDAPPVGSRVAFERLRERTDELELIISGLLAFALVTVPGRAFQHWAEKSVHVEGVLDMALWFAFATAVGLAWSLALAFMVHLAIRGYWVALIGLKSTFPLGIRWERIPMLGPVSQAYYRARVGDVGGVIDRADRAASMLFAMAILLALILVWVALVAGLMFLLASLLGLLADDGDRLAKAVLVAAYALFMLASLVPYVAERYIAREERAGRGSPRVERLVRTALRLYGLLVPQRLIMPVQGTLQSNLPGRGFMVVYVLMVGLAMVFSTFHIIGSASFSVLHRYDVLTSEAVEHGMTGAHYEDMRSDDDVLRRYPMIPSDRISGSHLRLFIPHQPQHDNALARERCADLVDGGNALEDTGSADLAVRCLGSLWTVTLDGAPVALDDFVPLERRDLSLRGLVGYIPVASLPPGRHDLAVTWNAEGEARGELRRRDYRIPFWITPALNLDAAGQ